MQDQWYAMPRRLRGGRGGQFIAAVGTPEDVAGGCVDGAVALAVRARNPGADLAIDAGRAIDYVWDPVQEVNGLEMPAVAGGASPREARLRRIRDIAGTVVRTLVTRRTPRQPLARITPLHGAPGDLDALPAQVGPRLHRPVQRLGHPVLDHPHPQPRPSSPVPVAMRR